jgi:hypothetical protein
MSAIEARRIPRLLAGECIRAAAKYLDCVYEA